MNHKGRHAHPLGKKPAPLGWDRLFVLFVCLFVWFFVCLNTRCSKVNIRSLQKPGKELENSDPPGNYKRC